MKKFAYLVACLLVFLTLTACGKSNDANITSTISPATTLTPITETEPENNITAENVIDLPVSEAVAILENLGASNVVTNADDFGGWDEDKIIVVEQSISAGEDFAADKEIKLTCKRLCQVYIVVKSEENLFFNTYDMDIYLDDEILGTVANGEALTTQIELLEGDYTIFAYKASDNETKASRKFSVGGNVTFSCYISHGVSIEFTNANTVDGIVGAAIEMPDVTGLVLSEAINQLSELGFINIQEEPFTGIWNNKNWLVTQQGVAAGTVVDQNEFIQLDCIKLDDYFYETYCGKSVRDIQELASASDFSIKFLDTSEKDLSSKVASMDTTEKDEWIAVFAEQDSSAFKTATVIVMSQSMTGAETLTETDAVSYSTNDQDTAKQGNSGVFSYRSKGDTYYIYYIIDFDGGYVYTFSDGDGSEICERVKIVSGDLNSVLIITYRDGENEWSYGLHFRWKNQPDHLILEDQDGFEWDYYSTTLRSALRLRDRKTIVDY